MRFIISWDEDNFGKFKQSRPWKLQGLLCFVVSGFFFSSFPQAEELGGALYKRIAKGTRFCDQVGFNGQLEFFVYAQG